MGEALERFSDDPAHWLREGITAIYETFRSHRAVTLAQCRCACDQRRGSRLVVPRDGGLGAADHRRGSKPSAPAAPLPRVWPARDLAISLNWMNERMLEITFAGQTPAVDEEHVLDVLVSGVAGRHLRRRSAVST